MIIDIHTHTPTHEAPVPPEARQPNALWRPDRVVEAAVSWDDYLREMEPVDRAVVFGIAFRQDRDPGVGRDGAGVSYAAGNVNDRTARFVASRPDKMIGFMSVHPDELDVQVEIQRCVHDLEMKGIKLGPNYQGFDPLGESAFAVYATAQRLGLPILFHAGTSPMRTAPIRYAHPLLFDDVAIAFPELRMILAHMGHPWHADTIAVIRKHPHVYADISAQFYRPWQQYNGLRLATEWNVLDKLLFGTDYPVTTPRETIDGLLNVNAVVEGTNLPRVPLDAMERILHRDSLALLGIER
jgi:hypothetical protein